MQGGDLVAARRQVTAAVGQPGNGEEGKAGVTVLYCG